ncbi:MAG: hypothetical protein AAF564_01020 [Bacteroidota bacterium]
MNNSLRTVLTILAVVFTFSACKSSEVMTDSTPAPVADAMPAAEPMAEPEAKAMSNDADAAMDIDLDALIEKHIAARGGVDNIKAVQTVKMTGKVEVMGMDIDMTNYLKRPNKIRAMLVIPAMNAEVNQGYDGEMGWMQNPGSDPQPMPKELSKGMKDQADIDGMLMNYEEKDITLEYLGEGMVNDMPAHKIKVTRPDQPDAIVYIDKASYLEVKLEGEGVNPQTGQPAKTETFMSDYRSVNGVQMAHLMEVKMDGTTFQKITMSEIVTNIEVDDSIFGMPGQTVDIQ